MSESQSSSSGRGVAVAAGLIVVLLVGGLWFGRGLQPPVAETQGRLHEVAKALRSYAANHGGRLPENLEAVVQEGYLAELPRDRSGFPISYHRISDRSARLTALGPDGKKGGYLFKRDHSLQVELSD